MDESKIMESIVRLRREMPRNGVVMDLCEFAEKMLGNPKLVRQRLGEAEKRKRAVERVKRWREKQKTSENPFE